MTTLDLQHVRLALAAFDEKLTSLLDARDKAAERVNNYRAKDDIFGLGREYLEEQLAAAKKAVAENLPAVNALRGHLAGLEAKASRRTSMTLAFTLSMPGRNSWNGRWSGEDKPYVLTHTFRDVAKAAAILETGYYSYRWEDGWCAGITVTEVDSREAAKLRRKSAGFCGYDWMMRAILQHGRIVSDHDLKKEASCAF